MAVQFQVAINSDAIWEQDIKQTPGYLQVIDVHQHWCGPCKVIQSSFRRVYLEHGDKAAIKFYTADMDMVEDLKNYKAQGCEPLFLFYRDGAKVAEVKGCNLPAISDVLFKELGIQM